MIDIYHNYTKILAAFLSTTLTHIVESSMFKKSLLSLALLVATPSFIKSETEEVVVAPTTVETRVEQAQPDVITLTFQLSKGEDTQAWDSLLQLLESFKQNPQDSIGLLRQFITLAETSPALTRSANCSIACNNSACQECTASCTQAE